MKVNVYAVFLDGVAKYVGITNKNPNQRWLCHLYDSKRIDRPLYRAIRKYGKDAFIIGVLEICASWAGACEAPVGAVV